VVLKLQKSASFRAGEFCKPHNFNTTPVRTPAPNASGLPQPGWLHHIESQTTRENPIRAGGFACRAGRVRGETGRAFIL